MKFIYASLMSLANITNSSEAMLFLFPIKGKKVSLATTTNAPSQPQAEAEDQNSVAAQVKAIMEQSGIDDGGPEPRMLKLVAHVSSKKFDALGDGSTNPDIYEVCNAVCESHCAANIKTSSAGPPRQFETIVACPIIPPGYSHPVGVVCIVDKIAQYEANFTQDDECRVLYTGEQIAELLTQMPLTVSRQALLLTPATFQTMWKDWTIDGGALGSGPPRAKNTDASEEEKRRAALRKGGYPPTASSPRKPSQKSSEEFTGVPSHLRDPIAKKFIFRAEHNGAMIHDLSFLSRTSISPAEVLVDVIARYKTVQQQLDAVQHRLSGALTKIDEQHHEVIAAKNEARSFQRQSAEIQAASERLMRMTFLHNRKQEASAAAGARDAEESSPLHSPVPPNSSSRQSVTAPSRQNSHGDEVKRSSTFLTSSERNSRPVSSSIRESNVEGVQDDRSASPSSPVRDISALPGKFMRSAQRLRNQSFFPTKPAAWNPKSKAVLGGSLLKKK